MSALAMMITNAGFDAIVAAESGGTDEIRLTEIGLTATPFIAAPTLDALPGEFKRIASVSGQAVRANVIHVTAYDPSADVYDVTGIGIYTSDGVLLAVYSAVEDPVLSKAELATGLIMFDIAFANDMAALIEFGDALFLNPPASETVKGVAEIADNGEADAGLDDTRIMSPKKVKRVVDALAAALVAAQNAFQTAINGAFAAYQVTVNGALTALQGRTITGGGLVSGGGNLTADRVLTVTGASTAELLAGTAANRALTPASFGGLARSLGDTGYLQRPDGTWEMYGNVSIGSGPASVSVTFPTVFPISCDQVLFSLLGNPDNGDESDEHFWVSGISTGAFGLNRSGDGNSVTVLWRAYGR